MTSSSRKTIIVLGIALAAQVFAVHANELREYYEAQKAELIGTFKAPEIGSSVGIKLKSGQTRTGTIIALTADTVTMETPAGPITYKKALLDQTTCTKLFAEDYATVIAIQRTRQLKASQASSATPQASAIHSARVSVKADLDKDKKTEKIMGKTSSNSDRDPKVTRKTTETQTYNLDITLSNPAATPDTYQLEWYFMSRSVGSKSSSTLCEKGSQEFTVAGRQRVKHAVASKTLTSGASKESSSGSENSDREVVDKNSASGSVYTGYVVLVKHGDKILAKNSNNHSFLKEDWLEKLNGPVSEASSYQEASGKKEKTAKKKKKKKDE
ncbi:MAG: hypothetical protein K9M45_03675 [Kiritimatiellales bacterium]|nr:hypothetical protein [Kiritimatiellales bacterium]